VLEFDACAGCCEVPVAFCASRISVVLDLGQRPRRCCPACCLRAPVLACSPPDRSQEAPEVRFGGSVSRYPAVPRLGATKGRLIRCTVPGSTPNRFAMTRTPGLPGVAGASTIRFSSVRAIGDRPSQNNAWASRVGAARSRLVAMSILPEPSEPVRTSWPLPAASPARTCAT
jgi:hypothetical protein